jgi:hypothetical protein
MAPRTTPLPCCHALDYQIPFPNACAPEKPRPYIRIRMSPAAIESHTDSHQQQNARALYGRARDRDPLLLPTGQLDALFAHRGLVAGRQRADKIVRVCRARSLHDFGLGRVGFAV